MKVNRFRQKKDNRVKCTLPIEAGGYRVIHPVILPTIAHSSTLRRIDQLTLKVLTQLTWLAGGKKMLRSVWWLLWTVTEQKVRGEKVYGKKVWKLFQKKSERKKVRKSCIANIFSGKNHEFFSMLLILVTGGFHLQKSREIKFKIFSLCTLH